ncbi:MAG: ComF family protein [Atopobiaceae bacterium]|uniref:ComF family protein n=1 Tax=Muricaecibacterium torontonense TaxID=3032871 RepID=A0A4S2F3F4_9ACTN|nr:phosphoribosyltransferase family protein [Muricaecibacterium torontonense]MCI8676023.1 ComF family protein [Atopobiaceae bacterium]TGY63375.1 ComF family protein [Muricaecibacterium torontonense]
MGLWRQVAQAAEELLWPTGCIACDQPGTLLCDQCQQQLAWVTQRWACPVCGAPYGWLACTECDRSWESAGCVSAFSYKGPAAALVTGYKDGHERRLAPVLASALACALDEASLCPGHPLPSLADFDGVTFIPSTAEAYRRRGFDPIEEVSRSLATIVDVPWVDTLFHGPTQDQRTLGREDRAANVAFSFSTAASVEGATLLLVDDVITTGASVREATRALLCRGADKVWVASVARTW